MKTKRVLCPERLRHVPHRFSWIDQRLVRDGQPDDGLTQRKLAFPGIGSAPKICRSVSPSLFGDTLGSEFCVGNLGKFPI
jgi:hypothetical protein